MLENFIFLNRIKKNGGKMLNPSHRGGTKCREQRLEMF